MFSRISIWKPTLITALIYCIIGLCIIVKPDAFSNYILKLMGILGILYGGYSFLRYFYEYKNEDANILDIAIGVIVFVLGVFLIFVPEKALTTMMFLAGIYLVIDGVIKIPYAINVAKTINNSLLLVIITALLPIILGVIIMSISYTFYQNVVWMFGLCLLLTGMMDLFSIYQLNKLKKEE